MYDQNEVTHMEERPGQTLGNYRLIRLFSDCFFTRLYLGHHLHANTPVLIRVLGLLPASAREEADFMAELGLFMQCRHPHLISILDGEVHNHVPFRVMDYPPHGMLRERRVQSPKLPLTMTLGYIKPLAAALQYLHERKIAHHRLTPESVWLGNHDKLLLSDPETDVEQSLRSRVDLNEYVMPPQIEYAMSYMAPELIEGQSGNAASDQYALAIMIYEWLCGQCPFKGESALEILFQQLKVPPPPLRQKNPTVPPEVEEVVLLALEKDPQKRFGSVKAFATALEQAILG